MTSLTSTNIFTISCLSIEPNPPPPASVNLFLQHGAKPCKVSIALFVDYSYYSSTIRGLFVLFVDYSRTIRTIRRLFADYSHYSSTIRGLFVLFVDYSHHSHYSLHYSSFINCRPQLTSRKFDPPPRLRQTLATLDINCITINLIFNNLIKYRFVTFRLNYISKKSHYTTI